MKYRKLINELVQVGDVASSPGGAPEESTVFAETGDTCIGLNSNETGWDNNFWYRPIKEDNWIAFSDRKPTKEDADMGGNIVFLDMGMHPPMSWRNAWNTPVISSKYWMPLNFIPRDPTRIKVDGHEVVPNKDGSIKVGCQTVSSQDFEEIVRQRNEAMK